MQRTARGFVLATIVLLVTLPILYVGGEGALYLATGRSHFPPGSGYRTIYAPLDWAGARWLIVNEGRERLANCWLRLSGDPLREAHVDPDWMPRFIYVVGPSHSMGRSSR